LQLLLIDAIGPFFRHSKNKRINWSKIPFSQIETRSGLRQECVETIPADFRRFVQRVSRLGYTGITLDDVAHLVPDRHYPLDLQAKITAYRELYRDLFGIAAAADMTIYITMDVMFYNESLERLLGRSWKKAATWLNDALSGLFTDFPEIGGIIMRFGETDGIDVEGDFRSRLLLKRSSQARRFLKQLLPVFERHSRLLIFRTWSVGVHQIGDLIWNKRTFLQVFRGLDSPSLVISMKYGESDFFRFLKLNPLFFLSDHKKIVEFQARREYEGFGAYPSFVGWDASGYVGQLRNAKNVVGASVWCQTGGWGKLRQLTFIRNSSPWVEINVFVLARLWQGATCEQAICEYAAVHLPDVPSWVLSEFLWLADYVIKRLLYVREFAQRQLFFRRLRLPPQLYVFWDRIIINHTLKRLIACLVTDPQTAVREGHEALEKLREMIELAEIYNLPHKGLKYQLATFEILAAARDYFFQPCTAETAEHLRRLKAEYKRRFRRNYSVTLQFGATSVRRAHFRWAIALLVRDRRRYRLLDRLVTLQMVTWLYPLVSRFARPIGPRFARKQGMGFDALFR
jgi:hypothetical protein